ncbi:MAG: hypothetical protein ACE5GQ_07660 [Nitrospinales bacterium]
MTGKFKAGRHIGAPLGYNHFFFGDFIEESGTGKDINFTYVQVQYTF